MSQLASAYANSQSDAAEREGAGLHVRVAHSPDADDAFMFYALATDEVEREGDTYEHILCDIETLNHEAFKGTYELTALSYHGYAHVADKYAILPVGSSVGDKYGPVLIRQEDVNIEALKAGEIPVAVPGELTTAYLALKLWAPKVQTVNVPFDQIMEKVASGEFAAGLIIHEGQLTYSDEGFHKIVDLGQWWFETTNLVLPLGCNGIRKDLGHDAIQRIGRTLHRSISWGLNNRQKTLDACQHYARDLAPAKTDRFVAMYVNQMTLEADVELRKAVKLMLWMGADLGIVPNKVEPEFIDLPIS